MAFVPKPVKDMDTGEMRQHLTEALRATPISRLEAIEGTLKDILKELKKLNEKDG